MSRPYSSELRTARAQANRRTVVDTAQRMFIDEGWTATTMAKVAEASGLTRQTVYQQFDSKLSLLDACIDNALSDGRAIPVRDMPEYQQMGVGDTRIRIDAGARWLCSAHERSAVIQNVLDQAAVTDVEAAARLAVRENTRWAEVRWATSLILGSEPADDVVDGMWTLTSRRIWLMLVRDRGWTADRWRQWFTVQAGAIVASA
ncbi:TetR/AcrR family transcriptional regulator [Gordonia rubripertincta]|uniref:Helix-turn-helix domain containing protein n=1 Tax=Gordonia rubripertincta TaxID=36822 RepID=A0ABT4MXI7_GORRU|nr:TetR/AcrR family transcriptional regulator [Gordonia rubripertincta]MCZ4550936.1 helix-turn-helix domain containing protein [Gordonia rubripertincta]